MAKKSFEGEIRNRYVIFIYCMLAMSVKKVTENGPNNGGVGEIDAAEGTGYCILTYRNKNSSSGKCLRSD